MYLEYISQFTICDYSDKVEKGIHKHHITPIATQLHEYNKKHNTHLTKKEFKEQGLCDDTCIMVIGGEHLLCHLYYVMDNPWDSSQKVAFLYMYEGSSSRYKDISLLSEEDIRRAEEICNQGIPEDISKKRVETLRKWHQTEEGKECLKNTGKKISKSLKSFYSSEDGRALSKEHSESLKKFYKTEEGKKRKEETGKKLKDFYQTEEGQKLKKSTSEKISKSHKEFFSTEDGIAFAKRRGRALSTTLNNRERRLEKAQPWLVEKGDLKFVVYSLTHFVKNAFESFSSANTNLNKGCYKGWTAHKISREEAKELLNSLYVYY